MTDTAELAPPGPGEVIDLVIQVLEFLMLVNPVRAELRDKFLATKQQAINTRNAIAARVAQGFTVYEATAYVSPAFANAAHDFIYLVVFPQGSMTARNKGLEKFLIMTFSF